MDNTETEQTIETTKLGRPTNKELKSHTKDIKPRKKPGPKAGEIAILNWYKARLLTSPKSRKVLQTILNAALDDKHKHQAIAWKIVTDRLLPMGLFDAGNAKGTTKIDITINTVGAEQVKIEAQKDSEAVEAEFEEIPDAT